MLDLSEHVRSNSALVCWHARIFFVIKAWPRRGAIRISRSSCCLPARTMSPLLWPPWGVSLCKRSVIRSRGCALLNRIGLLPRLVATRDISHHAFVLLLQDGTSPRHRQENHRVHASGCERSHSRTLSVSKRGTQVRLLLSVLPDSVGACINALLTVCAALFSAPYMQSTC